MSLRTYEIITKYIGKDSGVKVILEPNAVPTCDIKKKIITLPSNIKEENVFAALAEAMHEAGHVRMTNKEIAKIPTDEFEHSVLNAIEDIRIDRDNFTILPNIKEFYREEMRMLDKNRKNSQDIPLSARVLCDIIMRLEGFSEFCVNSPDVRRIINAHGLLNKAESLIDHLNYRDYGEARKVLKEICQVLRDEDKKREKPKKGNRCSEDGDGDNKSGKTNAAARLEEGLKKIVKNKEQVFSLGDRKGDHTKSDIATLGPLALKEMTKNKFVDLLDKKERRNISEDQGKLNTDNLPSFLTGDIEDLFKEPTIIKRKKSKILLVLDGSSSMQDRLIDGVPKQHLVVKAAKSIVAILKEVQEIEGLNVDYDIAIFTSEYRLLSKELWDREYFNINIPDGTHLSAAFSKAQDQILNDLEVDGNRLIILITDGMVNEGQIEDIKHEILKHNQDVRCLIIGIGASIQIQRLIGEDRNIIAEEIADVVLMEAIQDMLEG
ncbi:MAG: VWA domain-containing protein [Candidatus Omnitrophica bacterium]|nr:VWA domain-containing protein [Candidatus Omnitrophota bacterium]